MTMSAGLAVAITCMIFQVAKTQETTTPCSLIYCPPECYSETLPGRCPTCECPPTCQGVNCTEDEECVLKKVVCVRAPCFPVPTCVSKRETTTPCPLAYCPPECYSETRPGGCPTCECPPTCQGVNCTEDEECVLEEVICIRAPCFPVPTCVPKRETTTPRIPEVTTTPCMYEVLCVIGCERVIGSYGCPTCVCLPTCEGVRCPDGYECEMQMNQCTLKSCTSRPTCVPIKTTTSCPLIKCAPGCVSVPGLNGCNTCSCPPTCEDIKCSKDEECVLKQLKYCFTVPCFPTPVCVPRNDSCAGIPNTHGCDEFKFRWFYNSSANACQIFPYYGCTPSPNTFFSRKTCEESCKRTQPICDCDAGCYTIKRKNQNPKCICPNPCRDFSCSAGEVCKLRELNCGEPPKSCSHVPYCAPNSCATDILCGKKLCVYGLKRDEDGCELCECRDKPIPC